MGGKDIILENREEQENEIQALSSIYADAFVIEEDEKGKVYKVTIVPNPNELEENYVKVHLKFSFDDNYPHQPPPFLKVEKEEGLADKNVKELQWRINESAKEMTGQVMIFDLVELIREYLQQHNEKTISFYDQMVLRQQKEKTEKRNEELKNSEESLLLDMLNAELKRQANANINDIDAVEDLEEDEESEDEVEPQLTWQRTTELGRGSLGIVYHGVDKETNVPIAVKEIIFNSRVNDLWEKIENVRKAVNHLKSLSHDRLVEYLRTEVQTTDNSICLQIFQQYVPRTMSSVLEQTRSFAEFLLAVYVRQIVTGLQFLHGSGVAHGDLKLSNILVENTGDLRLSDFGLRQELESLIEKESTTKNLNYWGGNAEDVSADYSLHDMMKEDVYQLGLVVIALAGGNFRTKEPPPTFSRVGKDFIQRCLCDVDDRWTSSALLSHSFISNAPNNVEGCIPLTPTSFSMPVANPLRPPESQMPEDENLIDSGSSFELHSSRELSRYRADFEELEELGSGGFGVVVKAKNRLDGRFYAIKKVRLNIKQQSLTKMIREVTTLSRLNHQYVVRYFQAWLEGSDGDDGFDSDGESLDEFSSEDSLSDSDDQSIEFEDTHDSFPNTKRTTIMYIQMEYCKNSTLRQAIDDGVIDEDSRWRVLRQITEGLKHIHLQGIIHRDLKPPNIFLDGEGQVKIGDFGLATTGGAPFLQDVETDEESASDQNHTTGVGTPFYCCPELEKPGTLYDTKVDIYSLGIIFFEMCTHFSTGMERIMALTSLRKDGTFPTGFESNFLSEAEIIKSLLKENPKDRPSASELLNHLPSEMGEELLKEAVQNIVVPHTSVFSNLMEKLFAIPSEKHNDFTYEYHMEGILGNAELLTTGKLFQIITDICKTHGAIAVDTPILIPKNPLVNKNRVASLMDDTGTLLSLPHDLIFPFARYVAKNKIRDMRRYNYARTFRKHVAGGKPRQTYECSFDIVSSQSASTMVAMVADAEVLKVLTEILDRFQNEIGSYIIQINHAILFESILFICGLTKEQITKVKSELATSKKTSWETIASKLERDGTLSREKAQTLGLYFANVSKLGGIETQLSRIEPLFKKNRTAREAFVELKYFVRHLKTFGILDKRLSLDLSLLLNSQYYSGVIFQASMVNDVKSTHHDVVAVGGRYDRLVKSFLPPNAQLTCMTSGFSLAVERLGSLVASFEQRTRQRGKIRPSESEVFVCSSGRNMLEDRMQIASDLWSLGIKAEYTHSEKSSLEEIYLHCKASAILWMVIIKDKTFRSNGVVKVKNVERKSEIEVTRAELGPYMAQVLKRASAASSSPAEISLPPPSDVLAARQFTRDMLDVTVLGAETASKSKQKKKIINSAITRIFPALKRMMSPSVVKVVSIDLPMNTLRDICASANNDSFNSDKFPRNVRENVHSVFEFLMRNKKMPLVVLYSSKDDNFELFIPH